MNARIPQAALLLILCTPGIALASLPQGYAVAAARYEVVASQSGPGVTTRVDVESQQAGANVNTRYEVESVSVSGVDQTAISQALRDDMQKLVGKQVRPGGGRGPGAPAARGAARLHGQRQGAARRSNGTR